MFTEIYVIPWLTVNIWRTMRSTQDDVTAIETRRMSGGNLRTQEHPPPRASFTPDYHLRKTSFAKHNTSICYSCDPAEISRDRNGVYLLDSLRDSPYKRSVGTGGCAGLNAYAKVYHCHTTVSFFMCG